MNKLALIDNSPSGWSIMREQAEVLLKSNFLPPSIKSAEQAVAVIMTGAELGIGAMAALQTINIIQNKPTVSPQLMLALINRSGLLEDMKLESSVEGAVCMMKRKGRQAHTVRFGKQEATALGLSTKDNYKKQPGTMYQWRAVAMCARTVFPDVILGLYTPDEMGAQVDDTGEAIQEETAEPVITEAPYRLSSLGADDFLPDGDETKARDEASEQEHSHLDLQIEDAYRTLNSLREEAKEQDSKLKSIPSLFDAVNTKYHVSDGLNSLSIPDKQSLLVEINKSVERERKALAA